MHCNFICVLSVVIIKTDDDDDDDVSQTIQNIAIVTMERE